jgi:DNA-binding CsgD family transcriptional regulator
MACAYWQHDSLIPLLHKVDEGIWWSDHAKRSCLTPIEQEMFDDARYMGIGEGLSIPVRLADGELWVCQLTTGEIDPRDDIADGAFLAANRYIYRALKLAEAEDTNIMQEEDPLTGQQWRIISLLERDMPLRGVAKALNIAPSTVYNHMASAKARLGVHTIAAVLHAARKLRPSP